MKSLSVQLMGHHTPGSYQVITIVILMSVVKKTFSDLKWPTLDNMSSTLINVLLSVTHKMISKLVCPTYGPSRLESKNSAASHKNEESRFLLSAYEANPSVQWNRNDYKTFNFCHVSDSVFLFKWCVVTHNMGRQSVMAHKMDRHSVMARKCGQTEVWLPGDEPQAL